MHQPPTAPTQHVVPPPTTFVQRFSATRRGARLARLLAQHRFDVWGIPYGSDTSETAGLVVAELAANAVLHGRVQGRGFELALHIRESGTLLIEVTDTRTEPCPEATALPHPSAHDESGRGLLLVSALATRWGVRRRTPNAPGKTVWAECTFPHLTSEQVQQGQVSANSP